MSNRASGFIKYHRAMADAEDRVWNDPTPFCPRSARCDLILRARWSDGPFTTDYGIDLLKRGEFVGSLRFWARRWRWKKDRVARFLNRLEGDGFITRQRQGTHGAVYLIVNYARYQDDTRGDATAGETSLRQPRDADATKTKKGKKGNSLGRARETWLTPYLNALSAQHPDSVLEPGELARYISKVQEKVGPEETVARFCRYLVKTPLEYVSGKNFAKVNGQFAGDALTAGDAPRSGSSRDEFLRKQGYGVGA